MTPRHRALEDLRAALGDGALRSDPWSLEAYRSDWTHAPSAGVPLAVVVARSVVDVQTTMRWADQFGVPVTVRGRGTGLSGGANAVADGIVLSLEELVGTDVDVDTRTMRAAAGTLTSEVKAAASAHGLWYPPDPASGTMSSIGGNIATNASGPCCLKYGMTRDFVCGLDVVLADGRLLRLGGPYVKDAAGLSLLELFIGSEGRLGIVTGATLLLVPQPAPSALVVATFESVETAAEAVIAIRRTSSPSMLELMDAQTAQLLEGRFGLGLFTPAGAVLLVTSDAPGGARSSDVSAIAEACVANGSLNLVTTEEPEAVGRALAARNGLFEAIAAVGEFVIEDVVVPVPRLPDLLSGIGHIAQRHRMRIPVVAHAGDGNAHPIIVVPDDDPSARERAYAAFNAIGGLALDLGGSVTGEHGIGRIKRDLLATQLGPDVLDVHRAIKELFDPHGILNPGISY